MRGPNLQEIRCSTGTLAILPSRVLLRGPHAWAIPRASVVHVSCAAATAGGYHVTLRHADGRRFLLRGVATEDVLLLASIFDDIEGLPTSPTPEPSDEVAGSGATSQPDLPADGLPAAYQLAPPSQSSSRDDPPVMPPDLFIVDSQPTMPLSAPAAAGRDAASRPAAPRTPPRWEPRPPPAERGKQPARRDPPAQDTPTWATEPTRIWLPRVTLPPIPTPAFVETPPTAEIPAPAAPAASEQAPTMPGNPPSALDDTIPQRAVGRQARAAEPADAPSTDTPAPAAPQAPRRRARAFWP